MLSYHQDPLSSSLESHRPTGLIGVTSADSVKEGHSDRWRPHKPPTMAMGTVRETKPHDHDNTRGVPHRLDAGVAGHRSLAELEQNRRGGQQDDGNMP